ncbi:MAG: histidine--tRNA ligase [Candidatus Roizmanbacteria bacterium]|nr:MAG: histidine--tRNA ligase [Candidatus Roizmanbacteria bacterium]
MAIQLQPVKGFRDLYPADKALQNYVFDKLKAVASLYGFENYDGPILEPIELYLGKSSKELVEEQTFKIKDKKDQTLVMRPEMTPSLARMIAQKANQLVFPLKLFNLGLRFRYEAPQKGREREFYQADFDILGTENILADAEILAAAVNIFLNLGATENDFVIYINSRTFVDRKLTELGIENKKDIMSCIDRKDKISREAFLESLKKASLNEKQIIDLVSFLESEIKPQDDEYFKKLFNILKRYGIDQYFKINKNTVRGLDYYTGLVFEAKDLSGKINRALLGGGRYDNLVSAYNPNIKVPGIGFATSDVILLEFIKIINKAPQLNPCPTKYLVTIFSQETLNDSIQILNKLRKQNISAEIYPDTEKKLDKQLKYADRNNIPYAVIAGPEEIQKGIVKVKDMKTGEQKEINISDL